MTNETQYPYSAPQSLQGKIQETFDGGKDEALELFNTLPLKKFLKELSKNILPLEAAQYFALNCAQWVLPVWQKQYPTDRSVENCVKALEQHLKGEVTVEELRDAADVVYNTYLPTPYAADYIAAATAYWATIAAYDASYCTIRVTSPEQMQAFVESWLKNYFKSSVEGVKKNQTETECILAALVRDALKKLGVTVNDVREKGVKTGLPIGGNNLYTLLSGGNISLKLQKDLASHFNYELQTVLVEIIPQNDPPEAQN